MSLPIQMILSSPTILKESHNNLPSLWNPSWSEDDAVLDVFYEDPLYDELRRIKNKIDDDKYRKKWDLYKKYFNPFEFIHVSGNINRREENVAFYIPLSRSYFKMWEMITDFQLVSTDHTAVAWKSAHLAEGPGGFIEAVCQYRKRHHPCSFSTIGSDEYHAITLKSSCQNKDIPGFNRHHSFLKKNPSVRIHYGQDNTGNLYNTSNIHSFIQEVGKESCDLVTADGGFDFSINFNSQEYLSLPLLFSQIITALPLLKQNAHFILKMYDTTLYCSAELIWMIQHFFQEVILYKPVTSRPANSEKYLIAKYFQGYSSSLYESMLELHSKKFTSISSINRFFPSQTFPPCFAQALYDYNTLHTQQQLTITKRIITFIDNDCIHSPVASVASSCFPPFTHYPITLRDSILHSIQLCVDWCVRYQIAVNRHCKYLTCCSSFKEKIG